MCGKAGLIGWAMHTHTHSKSEASESSLIWWIVSQLKIESSFVWYNDKAD